MTAWASYRFGDIHAMIASVDAGTLRGLGERWQAAAALIRSHAASLAGDTEKLHHDWRSPTAADLFQDNVTKSVARMREWVAAAGRKAGNLSQAATEVLAAQSEMDRLKAEREARLAAAKTEAEKAAIEKEYDELARAEGQSIGGRLAALTPWQPPAGYTGLIGLAPNGTTAATVVFPQEVTFGEAPEMTGVTDAAEPADFGTGPGVPAPIPGPAAALPPLPLPLLLPGMPPAVVPGPAVGPVAGQSTAGRPAGIAGRVASGFGGYVPAGLFGRLAGAASLPGALTPGAPGAGGGGMPMIPPQGGTLGALSGRRARTRRPMPYPDEAPQEQTLEQQPEQAGPAPVSGRKAAVGKAATPREIPADAERQIGVALGR